MDWISSCPIKKNVFRKVLKMFLWGWSAEGGDLFQATPILLLPRILYSGLHWRIRSFLSANFFSATSCSLIVWFPNPLTADIQIHVIWDQGPRILYSGLHWRIRSLLSANFFSATSCSLVVWFPNPLYYWHPDACHLGYLTSSPPSLKFNRCPLKPKTLYF